MWSCMLVNGCRFSWSQAGFSFSKAKFQRQLKWDESTTDDCTSRQNRTIKQGAEMPY
ncbi:MAG: hypothetical protein WAqMacA_07260 [Shewanella algae]